MNDTGLSGDPTRFSMAPRDDIPEALREASGAEVRPPSMQQPKFKLQGKVWIWALLGCAIALPVGIVSSLLAAAQHTAAPGAAFIPARPGLNTVVVWQVNNSAATDTLLGHYSYKEAPAKELAPIVADGSIKLRKAAAQKFMEMVQAAKADKVSIIPVSGFRSIADQDYIFFGIKAQQGEQATERAAVSAPPGYSEHHTGYAIDIGDGTRRNTELEISFETTPAYRWMQANAARFGFELSFPRDNPQGVSYEPWHWRFVGDRNSLETFYKARTP